MFCELNNIGSVEVKFDRILPGDNERPNMDKADKEYDDLVRYWDARLRNDFVADDALLIVRGFRVSIESHVCANLVGMMTDEKGAEIVRASLLNDKDAVSSIIKNLVDAAFKASAEDLSEEE